MSHRWAFIFEAPETDPDADRLVIERGGVTSMVIPVPDMARAAQVAVDLADRKAVDFIELCGGFGPVGAGKIIEAVGGRLPIGSVAFGAESLQGIARVFAPKS